MSLGEEGLVNDDPPALDGVELVLGLHRDDDASVWIVGVPAHEHEIGEALAQFWKTIVNVDLGSAIDGCPGCGTVETEKIEGQPRVISKQGEDPLVKYTRHICLVGPGKNVLHKK